MKKREWKHCGWYGDLLGSLNIAQLGIGWSSAGGRCAPDIVLFHVMVAAIGLTQVGYGGPDLAPSGAEREAAGCPGDTGRGRDYCNPQHRDRRFIR